MISLQFLIKQPNYKQILSKPNLVDQLFINSPSYKCKKTTKINAGTECNINVLKIDSKIHNYFLILGYKHK